MLLDWQIAPGYYLYRHRVSVKTATPGFTLGEIAMPDGKKKTDEFFGDVEVYYDFLSATVPVTRPAARRRPRDHGQLPGLRRCRALLSAGHEDRRASQLPPPGTPAAPRADPAGGGAPMVSEQDSLCGASLPAAACLLIMASFFGCGLRARLHALRPADDPDPLRASSPARASRRRRPRSFLLSVVYVLGMALTYTIAGAAFAAAGQQAQAFFQQPWIIITFAALFVILALAMFGLYDLKIPSALETRLAGASGRAASRAPSPARRSWARFRRWSSAPASRRRWSRRSP